LRIRFDFPRNLRHFCRRTKARRNSLLLDFRAAAMNFSTGQRLAGPYSAPGFRPKIGCEIFPARIFSSRFNFLRRDEQLRCERFGIRAKRGGQMQILVDLMSGWRNLGVGRRRIVGNRRLISATERFRIFTASARGATVCVRKKFRHGRA
jgi:hypothetical protein